MPSIDYEVEYDNRARVPEHPQIFERWARNAAAYRAERGQALSEMRYGLGPRQTLEIFPALSAAGKPPLALFIHGGWWRSLEPRMFSHLARGANAHGVAVAVAGYDLCPNVAVADIIIQMQRACALLWQRHGRRIPVFGWSAGAHLAAAMVATDWRSLYPKAPADLVPAGYGVSGVYDLTPLTSISVNQDLRLTPEEARRVSPLFWPVEASRSFDVVVGGLEADEFKRQSRTLAETWRKAGALTRYGEIAGVNHFTVVDAFADPQSAMTARVVELARSIKP